MKIQSEKVSVLCLKTWKPERDCEYKIPFLYAVDTIVCYKMGVLEYFLMNLFMYLSIFGHDVYMSVGVRVYALGFYYYSEHMCFFLKENS